jgi:hypothetical protein
LRLSADGPTSDQTGGGGRGSVSSRHVPSGPTVTRTHFATGNGPTSPGSCGGRDRKDIDTYFQIWNAFVAPLQRPPGDADRRLGARRPTPTQRPNAPHNVPKSAGPGGRPYRRLRGDILHPVRATGGDPEGRADRRLPSGSLDGQPGPGRAREGSLCAYGWSFPRMSCSGTGHTVTPCCLRLIASTRYLGLPPVLRDNPHLDRRGRFLRRAKDRSVARCRSGGCWGRHAHSSTAASLPAVLSHFAHEIVARDLRLPCRSD